MHEQKAHFPIVVFPFFFLAVMGGEVATAGEVTLSDLAGMSIDLKFELTEKNRLYMKEENWRYPKFTINHGVYVNSEKVLYEKWEFIDKNNPEQILRFGDKNSHLADHNVLQFESGTGLRRIVKDSYGLDPPNFLKVFTTSFERIESEIRCSVSVKLFLREGQKLYVKPTERWGTFEVAWNKIEKQSCRVISGNIFKQ